MEPGVLMARESRLPVAGVPEELARLRLGEAPQSSCAAFTAAPGASSMAETGLSAGRRRLVRVRIAGAARVGLELPLRVGTGVSVVSQGSGSVVQTGVRVRGGL